ncbi:PLP-dependent transferase [Athelia psychrophila]|uniref:PLP-dependent transferase n=1 Tax=Athelia psychrophila TaxID=1759441 RepID=A0A166GCK7_9AGAM|nr:PLP-dependent transferase [Fibularhizoctonia sp. CBS 109695]
MANILQFEQIPVQGEPHTQIIPTHSDGVPVLVKITDPSFEATGNPSNVKVIPAEYYDRFLSQEAKERLPSPIRSLFPLEDRPGMISLLAGKPSPTTFPFTALNFSVRSPTDPSQETALSLTSEELAAGLQYGPTAGLDGLISWVEGLQAFSHGRKQGEGWSVCIGSGSQDLISKAVSALVNDGDAILVESPVYAGVLPMFETLHCQQIEVETDANGISSSSLRSILESWPAGTPKPRCLYTVPYGCNPTGMTASVERRKEVLALAREHDFLILEDDPYYYVYYGKAPRPASYFALELEEPEVGRVLRFDSLSKVLSAGIRIGIASGPEPFITAINRHTSTANLSANGLTQSIVLKLLTSWGYEGFSTHTKVVSDYYRGRRDVFEAAMQKHLKGLAEWTSPEAGMFVWFKLLLSPPGGSATGAEEDSAAIIRTHALEKGVLALPGTAFLPNGRKTAYVRASFSLLGDADIDEALRRLGSVVAEARG